MYPSLQRYILHSSVWILCLRTRGRSLILYNYRVYFQLNKEKDYHITKIWFSNYLMEIFTLWRKVKKKNKRQKMKIGCVWPKFVYSIYHRHSYLFKYQTRYTFFKYMLEPHGWCHAFKCYVNIDLYFFVSIFLFIVSPPPKKNKTV